MPTLCGLSGCQGGGRLGRNARWASVSDRSGAELGELQWQDRPRTLAYDSGNRLSSPQAVLTAWEHRLEDKFGRGAEGAAEPKEKLAMAASATLYSQLDCRDNGSKVI